MDRIFTNTVDKVDYNNIYTHLYFWLLSSVCP